MTDGDPSSSRWDWPAEERPPRRAWLFDVDGTLALRTHRGPYDLREVGTDMPNAPIVEMVRALKAQTEIVAVLLVSGRDERARRQTELWLSFNDIPYDGLYMRVSGDGRADADVKLDIFERQIRHSYDVVAVVDDRDSVVKMWRDAGLICLQVADGDF